MCPVGCHNDWLGAQEESILLDLKHLLREAKQRIPPTLMALYDPMDELRVRCGATAPRMALRSPACAPSAISPTLHSSTQRPGHPRYPPAGTGGEQRHQGLRVLRRPGPPRHRVPQAAAGLQGAGGPPEGLLWLRRLRRRDVIPSRGEAGPGARVPPEGPSVPHRWDWQRLDSLCLFVVVC